MLGPEDQAREKIDAALEKAGWKVQDYKLVNVHAGHGVALRNFPLLAGHGFADYLLYIGGRGPHIHDVMHDSFAECCSASGG